MSAPIRTCWGCSREVAEPATLCEACSPARIDPPAAAADAQPVPERLPPQGAASFPASALRTLSRRDWALVSLGAAGAGVITLGLLMSRAVASPEAAAHGAPPATSAATTAPVTAVTPAWSSENRARWVGDARKAAAFDLAADNRVQVWTRSVRPTLVVRCMASAIEVFVFTESAAKIEANTDDHTVTFSFDGEPALTERWADSVEHDGLFARDAAAFTDRLLLARTLTFSFTPHNAAPVNVHFGVTGLGALLEPVAAHCGRSTPPVR